jgi:hypothetical protein
LVAAHIRQVTDTELARLVASLHGQRRTFGLDAKPAASVSAVASDTRCHAADNCVLTAQGPRAWGRAVREGLDDRVQ